MYSGVRGYLSFEPYSAAKALVTVTLPFIDLSLQHAICKKKTPMRFQFKTWQNHADAVDAVIAGR